MKPIDNSKSVQTLFNTYFDKTKSHNNSDKKKDTVEISNTAKVFDKIDRFMNLGKSDRLQINDLNSAERNEFIKMQAALLKKGIVGYEVLEINGKPEKHDIVLQIGNERTYGAKLYKKRGYDKN